MTEWTNYGDVNPLEHGGIWVKKDEDSDTCFYIIKNELMEGDEKQQILELYIDTSDSWIDKEEVMNNIGMTEKTFDLVHFAIGAVEFYSYENFGTKTKTESKEETNNKLNELGIVI